MAYVNLAAATKLNRANRIITDIGAGGWMNIYTGIVPASPDIAPTDTLLASLPLSTTAGVASYAVQLALITAAGSNGVNGSYALTITGGGGTGAAGMFTVSGGVLSDVVISDPGHGYTGPPTLDGFGNAGLTGAIAIPVMTGLVVFNPILAATAVGSGVAGWARVAQASGVGVIDLDVGVTNAFSVVMDTTGIIAGGSVACSAEVLIEA